MLVTQIGTYLEKICSGDGLAETVIFDGPHGCGKTYNVSRFLESQGSLNSIYVSLFGFSSPDDVVLSLSEKLDSRFISTIHKQSFIVNDIATKPNKAYKQLLVIFDDLERKGKDLSFDSLFGIIDRLRHLGVRVVCAISSQEIKSAEDLESFLSFREKTFDRCVAVSPDPESLSSIWPEMDPAYYDSFLRLAKDNLRLIEKTTMTVSSIRAYMDEIGHSDFLEKAEIDNLTFLRCILMGLRCLLSTNDKKPKYGENDFARFRYDEIQNEFDAYCANEFHQLFSIEKNNANLKDLTINLMRCIDTNDFSDLYAYCYGSAKATILDEPPFNEEPFFLSDEGKNEFKRKFFDRLSEFDFSDGACQKFLQRVLGVFLPEMSLEEQKTLAHHIALSIPSENRESYIWELFIGTESKSQVNEFRKILSNELALKNKQDSFNQLSNLLKEKNYISLSDFLYEKEHATLLERETIAREFADRNFLLPDLSKTIDYSSWQYCHQISSFVSQLPEYASLLADLLRQQCANSQSKSLRSRCDILLQQYFGQPESNTQDTPS